MLSPLRDRANSIGLAEGKPLALVSPVRVRRKGPRPRACANSKAAVRCPVALVGLLLVLFIGSGFGLYTWHRLSSLNVELGALRAQMESRIQRLDAGIDFASRRQYLILGIRDEVMAANKRLGPDLAYEYSTHLVTACEKYPAVDPLLLLAIGAVESGYDTLATSPVKARGLYQIWPSTGRLLAGMLGWQYTDAMLLDPAKNTMLATLYLHILFTAYNDESLVLAEYNGGPLNAGYLRAGGNRASAETRSYVARVLDLRERLRKKFEQRESLPPGAVRGEAPREAKRLGERLVPVAAAP